MKNEYIPKLSKIKEVIKHTDLEYTFRMEYDGEVKPGQFLNFPFRSMEKLRFLLAELEMVWSILPSEE